MSSPQWRFSLLLILGSALWRSDAGAQGVQPVALNAPVIVIDRATGRGAGLLYLRNDLTHALPVYLAGTMTSPGAGTSAQIRFAGPNDSGDGADIYRATIGPNSTAVVRVLVLDQWEGGDFEAEVSNAFDRPKETKIATLKIRRAQLSLKLDGASPDRAKLSLIDGKLTRIVLRNDDAMAYPIAWELWIDGEKACGGKIIMPPKGIGMLDCTPHAPGTLARFGSALKEDPNRDGQQLILYDQASAARQPLKVFPVEASFNFFQPLTRDVTSYVIVILLLLAGAVFSLVLNYGIPHRLEKLAIAERMDDLTRRIADLSARLDSKLAVLLRLERSRLADMLKTRKTFSADFATLAALVSSGIEKLAGRVALSQQIDVTLARLAKLLPQGIPPAQLDHIEELIGKANVLLAKNEPTDADIEAARAAIADASTRVDTLSQPDAEFAKDLAQRIASLRDDVQTNVAARPVFVRINGLIPGPYSTLQSLPQGAVDVAWPLCFSFDMAVQKMLLIRDYVLLLEGTKDPDMSNRLSAREERLVKLLQRESWRGLQSARLLVRQMKDDIYPDQLVEAVLARQQVAIGLDPPVAYEQRPLVLSVSFHNAALDTAAAREEWGCEWDFGDQLTGKGWNISHYFLLQGDGAKGWLSRIMRGLWSRLRKAPAPKAPSAFAVCATFIDEKGSPVIDPATNEAVRISRPIEVRPSALGKTGERNKAEVQKLAVTLLLAVFALVAGAKEQLAKLDVLPGLIAVFLLGFGADRIKNLFTTKA